MNAIDLVTKSLGCSQSELARRLGVSTAVVSSWKRRGISLAMTKRVAEVSGVPAYVLNPDVFPNPMERPQWKNQNEI